MKAVITVVGKDMVGILASISGECAKFGANVNEVSQTILQDMFCMIMICDVDSITVSFGKFADELKERGKEKNLVVHVMHEDIFNAMHRI